MKVKIRIILMSIVVAQALQSSCKKTSKKPVNAAASSTPETNQKTDFIRTTKSFEASEETQTFETETGYLTVKFVSKNEAVTVIAEPDSLQNLTEQLLE